MLSSKDKIMTKTCGNVKDFLPKDSLRNALTTIENTNIGRLSAKVATPALSRSAPVVRPRPPPAPGPRLSYRPRKPRRWPDSQSDCYI